MNNTKPFEWNEITLSSPDTTGRKRLVGFPLKETPVLTIDYYGIMRILCCYDDSDDPEDDPYWCDPDIEDYVCDGGEITYWMYIELPQKIQEHRKQLKQLGPDEHWKYWINDSWMNDKDLRDSVLKAMEAKEKQYQAWKQQR